MSQRNKWFSYSVSITVRVLGVLILVVAASMSQPQPTRAAPQSWEKCPYIHFVQKGETLGIIALIYGIKVSEILEANALFPPYNLVEWQPLCIPRISFGKLYPTASLSANVFLNRLAIWGVCFPSRYPYKVRIRARASKAWKLVGYLYVQPNGSFEAHFRLPESLIEENYFHICLTEQGRDYKVCVTVDNRWVSGKRTKWNGTWITIPSR